MRGTPLPLHRGQRTSPSAMLIGASGLAPLHGQVEIDHGAARVATDHKPMVLGRERRADRRPEPSLAAGGKARVEFLDGGARVRHRLRVAVRARHQRPRIVAPVVHPHG